MLNFLGPFCNPLGEKKKEGGKSGVLQTVLWILLYLCHSIFPNSRDSVENSRATKMGDVNIPPKRFNLVDFYFGRTFWNPSISFLYLNENKFWNLDFLHKPFSCYSGCYTLRHSNRPDFVRYLTSLMSDIEGL